MACALRVCPRGKHIRLGPPHRRIVPAARTNERENSLCLAQTKEGHECMLRGLCVRNCVKLVRGCACAFACPGMRVFVRVCLRACACACACVLGMRWGALAGAHTRVRSPARHLRMRAHVRVLRACCARVRPPARAWARVSERGSSVRAGCGRASSCADVCANGHPHIGYCSFS